MSRFVLPCRKLGSRKSLRVRINTRNWAVAAAASFMTLLMTVTVALFLSSTHHIWISAYILANENIEDTKFSPSFNEYPFCKACSRIQTILAIQNYVGTEILLDKEFWDDKYVWVWISVVQKGPQSSSVTGVFCKNKITRPFEKANRWKRLLRAFNTALPGRYKLNQSKMWIISYLHNIHMQYIRIDNSVVVVPSQNYWDVLYGA